MKMIDNQLPDNSPLPQQFLIPEKLEFSRATRNKIAFALTPNKRNDARQLVKTPTMSDPDSFMRVLSTGPT